MSLSPKTSALQRTDSPLLSHKQRKLSHEERKETKPTLVAEKFKVMRFGNPQHQSGRPIIALQVAYAGKLAHCIGKESIVPVKMKDSPAQSPQAFPCMRFCILCFCIALPMSVLCIYVAQIMSLQSRCRQAI